MRQEDARHGRRAVLALADGTVLHGYGLGAPGSSVGELVFNTAMTGYQEILTDPSYAGQIIAFTFPHIGNVGTNDEDIEHQTPFARGVVLKADITEPSNYRASQPLHRWLSVRNLPGIAGVDTRRLTLLLRERGAQNAAIQWQESAEPDVEAALQAARRAPSMEGLDLAAQVTSGQRYHGWDEGLWQQGAGYARIEGAGPKIAVLDFGIKRNILRSLRQMNADLTVYPAATPAATILNDAPDGVFLSNGPGDPAATGAYAVPTVQTLVRAGKPLFGICLGHQILALALGATTTKMKFGHHGANHPVKDLTTGKVEITSQNHGFAVDPASLPAGVAATHISLFDQSLEGLQVEGRPVFSVQYHPEASPGPQDSAYLFERFMTYLRNS